MPDDVIDIVLEFRPAHFEFFNLLVGGEVNVLLDPINLVVQPVIFVKNIAKMMVGAFEPADDVAMFREFS